MSTPSWQPIWSSWWSEGTFWSTTNLRLCWSRRTGCLPRSSRPTCRQEVSRRQLTDWSVCWSSSIFTQKSFILTRPTDLRDTPTLQWSRWCIDDVRWQLLRLYLKHSVCQFITAFYFMTCRNTTFKLESIFSLYFIPKDNEEILVSRETFLDYRPLKTRIKSTKLINMLYDANDQIY